MRHFRSLDEIQLKNSCLTIGSFDGVHLGHQAILSAMVSAAQADEIPSVALTFHPHPSTVIPDRPPIKYLSSPEEKAAILGTLGIDYVVTHPFDEGLSRLGPGAFIDLVQGRLNFQSLWVGPDFAFGRRREGNLKFLEDLSLKRGFRLHVLSPIELDGRVVRSSLIREALQRGEVALVSAFLGRRYEIRGEVTGGEGRGRKLGFPTVNLSVWPDRALPATGVYACLARAEGKDALAVTNIGFRPTFEGDHRQPVVEAHLLDFEGELYSKEVSLAFVRRLRDEMRFSGPDELVRQIQADIKHARRILASELDARLVRGASDAAS